MWYKKFDAFALNLSYINNDEDHCVYIKVIGDHILTIILYVESMLFIGNKVMTREIKTYIFGTFDMKDLGAKNVTTLIVFIFIIE